MNKSVTTSIIGNNEEWFGLAVMLPDGKKREYASLFPKRESAQDICDMINRNSVSECQIYDIIEDILG